MIVCPWMRGCGSDLLLVNMDEYEFLENEGGHERNGRARDVTPLRKGQVQPKPGQQQESPLRRALEQPPLKRFKVGMIGLIQLLYCTLLHFIVLYCTLLYFFVTVSLSG